MKNRLLQLGLFPETLPPCFNSNDCKRAFRGLSQTLSIKKFHKKRHSIPVPYSGTKHDGSRRLYATPHPIPYYHICEFIGSNWKTFQRQFEMSSYSISRPEKAVGQVERAIVVTPLSEVASLVSKKVRHAPFILKADVAQFYHSIYTHIIAWAAHGKERCKHHRSRNSTTNRFNRLDFFVRNVQEGQTRGILVGPDAYRIIAEFVAVKVDQILAQRGKGLIVGAARHVDDFYIGVRSEVDASVALSQLRECLFEYELHVNDLKTTILPGVDALDDPWASELRLLSDELGHDKSQRRIVAFLDQAVTVARSTKTQSPVKLAVRRADANSLYDDPLYEFCENYLQRMAYHFPHAIDYICLFVVKRFATVGEIDIDGWTEVVNSGLVRHLKLAHHHEACWFLWLGVMCDLQIHDDVIKLIEEQDNWHLKALCIESHVAGKQLRRPRIRFHNRISSDGRDWLVNLVARSNEFTKASFSGCYVDECEHLAIRRLKLIDLDTHLQKVAVHNVHAISNVRFGYEDEDDEPPDDDQAPWDVLEDNPFG